MRCGRLLVPIVVTLLFPIAQAQLRNGGGQGMNTGNVHVRVVLENGRSAGPYLLIHLMENSSSIAVGTTYSNDNGEAQFDGLPLGSYHVEVSGDGIATTASETFYVDNRKMTQSTWVTVKRLEESGPAPVSAHANMVSATDLNVPSKARKELDKANEAMAMQNWKKAMEHLNQAIALAPQFVTAYNNLGVLYAKMNDIPHEEVALQKAVSLDEHFAPALLNYGKLCVQQKNFPQAEDLLRKAATVDPNNAQGLMLLAEAEYMNRHFDTAIVSARQAHSLGQDHPPFVHYIAARSYQQQNQQAEALAQLRLFLQEEPKGPRADYVRADVAKIEKATQSGQGSPQ
jgi:tetratricopeptide (TPR) repeat protein